MRLFVWVLIVALFALPAGADVVIKSGAGTETLTIDANNNAQVIQGASTRKTYTATATALTTTAIYSMQIEAAADVGFRLTKLCVQYALGATAAGTVITTTVNRRTTASSGGTLLTNENTATPSVAKHDYSDANYSGAVRLTPTLGTIGALLDSWSFPQTVVAGTTGITPISMVCKDYDIESRKPITVQAGTANGLSIAVSAGGAGSLAVGGITATFIQE